MKKPLQRDIGRLRAAAKSLEGVAKRITTMGYGISADIVERAAKECTDIADMLDQTTK